MMSYCSENLNGLIIETVLVFRGLKIKEQMDFYHCRVVVSTHC